MARRNGASRQRDRVQASKRHRIDDRWVSERMLGILASQEDDREREQERSHGT